ncbi:hypothetical protein [Thermomonospora amylolytica]|uniref:hypothetical protein n=1 Tax=Thermomonospora amylolytica TaxID=1411117 RepID=UPI0013007561|nr:hypothetical protein [Thermomonospora amylolytica]
MIGREPWERYSGDEIEAAIAVMLLRENPSAQRIRPSQGDGGVDVLVCHADGAWEVYQVKGFTSTLSYSHKKQIEKSWNRLLNFTEDRKIKVKAWHVVRPIDPTHEDRDWLSNLTAGSGIPSDWIGLTQVDSWAAKYPDVMDYYFHGGKDRVLEMVRTFLSAASFDNSITSGKISEPAQAIESLLDLHNALNATDPHYRYELHIGKAPKPGDLKFAPSVPGLIFSTMLIRDETMAQVDVIARYNEAVHDRPVPIKVTLKPESAQDQIAVEEFVKYGTPIEQVPADIVEADLPGGFALTEVSAGTLSILPIDTRADLQHFELYASGGGEDSQSVSMRMSAPSRGIDGSGAWSWEGMDSSGILHFGLKVDPSRKKVNVWTRCEAIAGHRPSQAVRVLKLLSTLKPGTTVGLRIEDGPSVFQIEDIPKPLADLNAIKYQLDVCTDLLEIQRHIPQSLTIPDADEVTMEDFKQWRDAATLLRGGIIMNKWQTLGVTLHQQSNQLRLPARVRTTKPLSIRLGGTEWVLGYVDFEVIAERWEVTSTDGLTGVLYPGVDNRVKLSLANDIEDAQRRAESGVVQVAQLPAS